MPYTTFYFRMGSFPALLLLLVLPGSHMAGEDTQVFLQVQGESFRANCSYDMHKHSHEKKFWCKEQPERYCTDLSLSFPSEERIGPNRALYHPVELRDSGGGWFSVIMTALRKEDSGTYQCGVWVEMKQVLLQRIQMVVSPKETVTVFAKKGKSLFLHCSYSMTVNIRELQHFIWCKMVSRIRCQPIIRGNADQSIVKAERTEMMNDFSWKMIRVWLKKLQLNDSGEYHLESRFQGRNKLLKRIMLKVLASAGSSKTERTEQKQSDFSDLTEKRRRGGEKWNMDASPIDDSRKDQRTPYAVMVLISLLATAVLIATVTLITSCIRKKRAGKEMDFDRHPAFRKGVLQEGREKASRMPDGDHNESTIYAAIRHQPQPKPEDVMYVNIQPSPKVFLLQEPPGSSHPSGPVEYATLIFKDTTL
ncbi:triggering receptor expressed on myeloid cells B1 precursor [Gallus gallus]|uniref:Triggering receptor expressed on myeloid cells B1 n=1 Tax=Gallus gallus TaxID=9031 RepID=A0A8V1ACN9_CHICK|nr:triggering receptor expressed on myeloid cells B1 precursor [Gallus gallus]